MTATTKVQVIREYNVTEEQISRATHVTMGDEHFYIVESQTTVGVEYRVRWSREFSKLTCTCPAGLEGMSCWHMRAALAAETLYKAEVRRQRQAEQAEIERSAAYELERKMHELEVLQAELDELQARQVKQTVEPRQYEAWTETGVEYRNI